MSEYSGYKIKRTHALAPLASVYEAVATDGRPDRFALKVFHPPASTEVRRFYALEGWLLAAERQQQAAKKDGTVLEVLATGRCEEGAFAVMPWQGRSLEPWIKTLGHKGDTLRALAECLLNTLEKWEAQTGGPHGNLKPANVFLDRSGPLVGMTAQLSDPWFMPGAKVEQLRLADLAAIGAMLAQIVRRRPPGAWPIEEAPEWKALGHGGKGWLDFCNYLLNPSPNEGEVTIAEARRRLRKIPKDSNPVRYEQKTIPVAEKQGKLRLVASPTGENGSVAIHADAKLYAGLFDENENASISIDPHRKAYVHLIRGELAVNGQKISSGDAVMLEQESQIQITDAYKAEVLVFELAA